MLLVRRGRSAQLRWLAHQLSAHQQCQQHARGPGGARPWSSSEAPDGPLPPSALDAVQQAMGGDAARTSEQLAHMLTPAQKAYLAAALSKTVHQDIDAEEGYVKELFEAADKDGDQVLAKKEFQNALRLHKSLDKSNDRTPPSWSALRMLFIASAIPFVGFGFLDNFIMLVAGEEIDEAFGRQLGLSTLASAGLGNLVADVIGVGAANGIEASVRKLPFIRDFKLSKHQSAMPSTKMTKAIGATIGVMVGCVLGLAPLWYNGTFFTTR